MLDIGRKSHMRGNGSISQKEGLFEMIKTLAMLKMEKNFVAVIEKKYPRKPYLEYNIAQLLERLKQEVKELEEAYIAGKYEEAKRECADVSNIVDFIYEKVI